ncbi:MAG: exosortase/archaeosortase family protein [DPANN group archaeon]|nr:exosortase/archaeosortase family protein [DPANN group archaeon]
MTHRLQNIKVNKNKNILISKWNKFEKKTTKKFTHSQFKMWDTLIFLIRFCVLAIPLHLIIWTGYDFHHIITITSYFTSKLLSTLGTDFFQIDNTFIITTATGTLIADIIKDCSGWKSFLTLFSLILATRHSTIKARALGIIIGIFAIFIGNIFRLATTFHLTYLKGLEIFDITHNILWQGGLIILVLAIWLFWLENIAFNKRYI